MDLVPLVAEGLHQKGLEKSVVPEHLERDPFAAISQPDAAIGRVLDETDLGESANHLGHRRGFDVQSARKRLGAHPVTVAAKEKNLFEIVLLRLRELQSRIVIRVGLSNLVHFFRLA